MVSLLRSRRPTPDARPKINTPINAMMVLGIMSDSMVRNDACNRRSKARRSSSVARSSLPDDMAQKLFRADQLRPVHTERLIDHPYARRCLVGIAIRESARPIPLRIGNFYVVITISKEQLIESAQDFSARALAAYRDEDGRAILHNAAIAMEHLCKAYLYSLHPTLLMEIKNGSMDSLLFLAGVTKSLPSGKYPRTISAREALSRVQRVLRSLQTPRESLGQLVDIRDGQLHVGFLPPASATDVFTAFLRFSNELYDEMGVAEEDRWGEYDEMITHLISMSLSEIERAVHVRITAARQRLDSWIERVPDAERDSVCMARQVAAAPNLGSTEEYEATRCPACGDEDAYRVGNVELEWRVDEEPGDFEGEVDLVGPFLERRFWPQEFVCGVCELRLRTRQEMAAAGMQVDEEVDQADPRDYPDEAEDIVAPYR